MSAGLGAVTAKVFERWGWKCLPFVVLWWALFWPIGTVWLGVSLVGLFRAADRSEAGRADRSVRRLLSYYPSGWRARYGEGFADTVRQAVLEGHGGLRLELNIARESAAVWWQTDRRNLLTLTCWWLCWVPLVAQGLVPLGIKLSGGTHRSWFLPLFLPGALPWIVMTAMFAVGFAMLVAAVRGTPALRHAGAGAS